MGTGDGARRRVVAVVGDRFSAAATIPLLSNRAGAVGERFMPNTLDVPSRPGRSIAWYFQMRTI